MSAEAPAAPPPSGVNIVDPGPPKPPPPPTSQINVSALPTSATPAPPPKKGSAREAMHQALRKQAGEEPPAAPPAAGKKDDSAPQAAPKGAGEESPPSPAPGAAEAAGEPGKKPKANPWKLYEAEKQARAELEQRFQEYRAKVPKDVDVAALTDRATKAEKQANDLANEIRYHVYEKSPEFQQQFQAPYEAAFRRNLDDLKEVPVKDPNTDQVRAFTGDDLAQLSFMTLGQAKEVANRLFPDFADDVLAARKEIRALWDKRQGALNEWKDKGGERAKQATETFQRQRSDLARSVQETWTAANEELVNHETRGEYFKPRDGDQEWNSRLEAGYKLVDQAFAVNLLDPNLKPEDRAAAVKRYAAARARAASWGPLRHENEQLKVRVAELEKELKAFKDTTPPAGGSQARPGEGRALSAREAMRDALRKRAT